MIAVLLLMFSAGIGLSQAVSDPNQVTLRWLRLGGILSLVFIALGCGVYWRISERGATPVALPYLLTTAALVSFIQLIATQLAKRDIQRIAALALFVIAMVPVVLLLFQAAPPKLRLDSADVRLGFAVVILPWIASGLLGGFLMTMLLGHAYLTAGNEMTQAPFRRLVIMLAVLLLARAGLSVAFGLWPYLSAEVPRHQRMWNTVMLTARYAVGLIVPAIFTYMTYDCVCRRANQSATGILYVAAVLVIVGEGIALALLASTGYVF